MLDWVQGLPDWSHKENSKQEGRASGWQAGLFRGLQVAADCTSAAAPEPAWRAAPVLLPFPHCNTHRKADGEDGVDAEAGGQAAGSSQADPANTRMGGYNKHSTTLTLRGFSFIQYSPMQAAHGRKLVQVGRGPWLRAGGGVRREVSRSRSWALHTHTPPLPHCPTLRAPAIATSAQRSVPT